MEGQLHVAQLLAEQPAHELPPPTGTDTPLAFLEKDAKVETCRSASLSHLGQLAASSARLKGRSRSNLLSQLGQQYS